MAMTAVGQFSRPKLLAVLLVTYMVNYADRMTISVLGESIKRDLALSDAQVGMLGGTAFTILYVLVSFPVGRLVERHRRATIMWIAIGLWSTATVACGFARNFTELALCRAAVGVGEGAFIPAVLSLLSDYFPPNRRASAYSTIVLGLPLGGMIGAIVGGWVAARHGWHIAFMVIGAPGLLMALIVRQVVVEPPRGSSDGAAPAGNVPTIADVLRTLASKPAFLHLTLGGGLVQIVSYAIALFLFPYLTRNFGVNYAQAGLAVGLLNGASLTVGILGGGLLSDHLGSRDVRWYGWTPAIAMLMTFPVYLASLFQSSWLITTMLLFIPSAVASAFAPTIAATIQGLVPPTMRGTTAALNGAMSHVISLGLGSLLIGLVSDHFTRLSFAMATGGRDYAQCGTGSQPALATLCQQSSGQGLRWSLMALSAFLLWGSIHFLIASRSLRRDYGHGATQ
ncbi:spinster family MFS transporter [Sphingobium baderi]|uniref:Major facilitator superfamily (MFS) profile domain-containing protein n=1 Tax=Sphingobium baderi TaxID=1332080 RepID=A0A0S3EYA7_9SPHN|nr:MFS transporter [Sphingobium baderi]ALR20383.1 hypothetical protein ATN00_08765 [Sphingobium baderi]